MILRVLTLIARGCGAGSFRGIALKSSLHTYLPQGTFSHHGTHSQGKAEAPQEGNGAPSCQWQACVTRVSLLEPILGKRS
jgi:hypothetical protein